MTLVLELPAELEAKLEAAAAEAGTDVAAFIVAAAREKVGSRSTITQDERRAIMGRLRGSVTGGQTVDEFLAERHAEGRKEVGL
jgi:hypothetical protein